MSHKYVWKCLQSCEIYCIALALSNARQGDLEKGFAFAEKNAFKIEKIISVKELLQELKEQSLSAEESMGGCLRIEYEKTLEKLASLKEEYALALKIELILLRDECGREIGLLREEYLKAMELSSSLKERYLKAVDKANLLKAELVELFERYSLGNSLCTVRI